MSEQKKLVPNHQKRVTLFHKSGTAHEFEPVDAKEILLQAESEYAKDLSFWDKLKAAVENVAEAVDQAVDTATAVIETATAVQDQIEDLSDAVKPKKKG